MFLCLLLEHFLRTDITCLAPSTLSISLFHCFYSFIIACPSPHPELCRYGKACRLFDCEKWHPEDRRQKPCQEGEDGNPCELGNEGGCKFLHPKTKTRRTRFDSVASNGAGGPQTFRSKYSKVPGSGYVCHICNIPGHWKEQCPQLEIGERRQQQRQQREQERLQNQEK